MINSEFEVWYSQLMHRQLSQQMHHRDYYFQG